MVDTLVNGYLYGSYARGDQDEESDVDILRTVDLRLETNITFITGKTTLYSILREYAVEDNSIHCFNYLDHNKAYKSTIKRSKNKLLVIDNADICHSIIIVILKLLSRSKTMTKEMILDPISQG